MRSRSSHRRRSRSGLIRAVVMAAGLVIWTPAGAADGGSILEEPMQPITKGGPSIPVCKACTATELLDVGNQRVAERNAPEYAAPRDAGPMMMQRDGGMAGAADESYVGTVITVPGAATVILPVVIQ